MVGPPPPPPPGPPPPPTSGPPAVDPKGRDRLLESIRSGTKLKKTVTVDKSAPVLGGKSTNGGGSRESEVRPGRPAILSGSATIARTNGLAGLFADGMPKLKPTGLSIGKQSQSSSLSSLPTANSSSLHGGSTTKSDIIRKPIDSRVRGPPPQPPPTALKPALPNSVSDTTLTNNSQGTHTRSQSTVSLQNGRVGRGGKPTLMPKPHAPAPPPPPGRTVTRTQSMRAPASPPIVPQTPGGPVFPSSTELSGRTPFHMSTDSLVRGGMRPRPLRPPSTRPPPPPKQPLPPPPGAPPPAPPPAPPHRAAPPLPGSNQPPPPPVRTTSNNGMARNGMSNEFESRFASRFRKINDFPPPPAFTNVPKIYNSKTVAKAQAPAPPVPTGHVQLGPQRNWTYNSSNC